jgi:hypothetical protein
MAVTNADIQAWTAANPAASHQDIYNAMQQHGVTPDQLAQATGWDANAINTQYAALSQPAAPNNPYQLTSPNQNLGGEYNGWSYQQGGGKPNVAQLMATTGVDFQQASDLLYGNVGSNTDTRNWNSIMSSQDILSNAYGGLKDMYGGGYGTSVEYDPISRTYTTFLTGNNGVKLTSIGSGSSLQDASTNLNGWQRFGLTQAPTVGNQYTTLTQQPQTPPVQTQTPSYVNNAFPQYTPDYGNLTQQPVAQPQYTPNYANNALMRPVTQNSNITAQNQYQNMGYNNKRSSLWGDW